MIYIVEITKEYHNCKHKNAFFYNQDKDDFEGKTYDLVYCPDCKSFWEERSRLGKHTYPKKSFSEEIFNNGKSL